MKPSPDDSAATAEHRHRQLHGWLQSRHPDWRNLCVGPFSPVSSGFSNETVVIDLTYESGSSETTNQRLALRCVPHGTPLFPEYDLTLQYRLQAALADSDLRVPRMQGLETDPAVLGAPFYLMEFIEGSIASGRSPGFHGHGLFFDAPGTQRRAMYFDALDQLVKLHRWPWRTTDAASLFGQPASGAAAIDAEIRKIEHWLDWADMGSLDVLRSGLQWLKAQRIDPQDLVVCWGDARPGNMVYRDGRVAALLDWELAYLAPAEFDLAYFVLVDQVTAEMNGVPRLDHLPGAEETIAYYEHQTGRPVRDYRYAEVFQAVRLAAMLVLTVRASPAHLSLPADYATHNVLTEKLAELLGRER